MPEVVGHTYEVISSPQACILDRPRMSSRFLRFVDLVLQTFYGPLLGPCAVVTIYHDELD